MGNPTKELSDSLNELGVEYDTYDLPNGEHGVSWIGVNGIEWEAVQRGENFEIHALQLVTPEQAIAATVGNAREPSDDVIERIERFCTDYAQCLMDSTILVKRNYESMDLRAVKKAEVVEDRLIRELAEYIVTADNVGCGIQFAHTFDRPPETMVGETVFDGEGNAIGWIVDATVGKDIERYDGSGRRGTVAILQGGRKPEEVLFVHEEGGVTHYLPEDAGTCRRVFIKDWLWECSECHSRHDSGHLYNFCPNCGGRIVEEDK